MGILHGESGTSRSAGQLEARSHQIKLSRLKRAKSTMSIVDRRQVVDPLF